MPKLWRTKIILTEWRTPYPSLCFHLVSSKAFSWFLGGNTLRPFQKNNNWLHWRPERNSVTYLCRLKFRFTLLFLLILSDISFTVFYSFLITSDQSYCSRVKLPLMETTHILQLCGSCESCQWNTSTEETTKLRPLDKAGLDLLSSLSVKLFVVWKQTNQASDFMIAVMRFYHEFKS